MSTRAYRIIEIKSEGTPSINLSHQDALANYLGVFEEDGLFSIDKGTLKEFLDSKELQDTYEVDGEQLKQLQADYDNSDDDYIEYLTY
jgi:hypothetical protein